MQLAKYIAIRTIAVAALFVLGNVLYTHTFWKDDISKHGDILENLWVIDPTTEIIYFGESSNFHVPDGTAKQPRISDYLNDALPTVKVWHVDNSGLHGGIYRSLIKHIPKDMPLKCIVVTLNARSFDATWRHSQFENYLAKSERMLGPEPKLWKRFAVALKDYDYKPLKERTADLQL